MVWRFLSPDRIACSMGYLIPSSHEMPSSLSAIKALKSVSSSPSTSASSRSACKVRRLDDSLLPRRLLPAGLWRAGGEGQALLLRSCALAAALVAAGQDGRQLLLALAGDAGDAHYALLRRSLGCLVADCV